MKIYCISDIHGFLAEFEEALALVLEHLDEPDTKLCLLGDYIHGGGDGSRVLGKIMELQNKYGEDKVIALLGNHEDFVLTGYSTVNNMNIIEDEGYGTDDGSDDKYISWFESLPRYYTEGNTIFVHAGIEEDAGDMWEWATGDDIFTGKYPAETGKIEGLDMKVVAGHIGTCKIADDHSFHDIYYDGESHYYIDGTVIDSGYIPVLLVDTEEDKYYQVTESGINLVFPYEEWM